MRPSRDMNTDHLRRDHLTDRSGEQDRARRAVMWRVEKKGLSRADALTILCALGLTEAADPADLPLQVPW